MWIKTESIDSQYAIALSDIAQGVKNWPMWGRLGWQETKRRYKRTIIGPFWTTLSLGIFILTLGLLWAHLWKQDTKSYLPFLAAGMLTWTLVASIITEGCTAFVAGESLIKQLRFSYTILACSIVWRNVIVFLHNLIIYAAIVLYGGVPVTWSTLLVVPGLFFVCASGVWVAILLGMFCARFRDVQQVIVSLLQVSMFVTPIFWNSDQLGPKFASVVNYNVLFHYVDVIRSPLLGRAPSYLTWLVVIGGTVAGWVFTMRIFGQFRKKVAYWL